MHLFFYVNFESTVDFDFSATENGNPGIGGTEYATISLATELVKQALIDVTIISNVKLKLSSSVHYLRMPNLISALLCSEVADNYLVYRPNIEVSDQVLSAYRETKAKLIAWTHVSPSPNHLRQISRLEKLAGVVALGKRQYFSWVDNPANRKTTVIQNGQYFPRRTINPSLNKNVTYLGALVPQKGFHLLAEQWPKIARKCKGARLIVVGSGSLYDTNASLGPLGLAEKNYEKKILELLGSSISSVDFRGKVDSHEKARIIEATRIGVVNPSGRTENCPAAALDFQAAGVPVVSAKRYGLIDTVLNNKTGVLVKRKKDLAKVIIQLIDDNDRVSRLSRYCFANVKANYAFSIIVNQWIDFLNRLETSSRIYQPTVRDVVNWTEFIACINSKIMSKSISRGTCLSVIELKTILKKYLLH